MINEKIYTQFKEYLNYLLVNSTVESPLWNKEVLIGLKKPGWTYIDGCMMVALIAYYKTTNNKEILNYVDNFIDKLVDDDGHVTIYYYDNYNNFTTTGCDSDPCNMAKVLYTLYDETHKEKYHKAIDFFMNNQVRKLPRIRGNFWHKIKYYNQIWLDGLLLYLDKNTNMFYQVPNMQSKDGNYLETSGTLMVAYAILKAIRLNALPKSYQEIGLNILYGTCNKYLTKSPEGNYTFGGICIGAGLTASRTDKYAGTYDMYISREIVNDDGKGIGPLILAFSEALLIK